MFRKHFSSSLRSKKRSVKAFERSSDRGQRLRRDSEGAPGEVRRSILAESETESEMRSTDSDLVQQQPESCPLRALRRYNGAQTRIPAANGSRYAHPPTSRTCGRADIIVVQKDTSTNSCSLRMPTLSHTLPQQ